MMPTSGTDAVGLLESDAGSPKFERLTRPIQVIARPLGHFITRPKLAICGHFRCLAALTILVSFSSRDREMPVPFEGSEGIT